MVQHFSTIFITFSVLLINFINISEACNGYTLKLNKAKNCINNSIIKLEKPGAILDKDCNLILSGCAVVSKGFKTAKGKYIINKSPMPEMDGELDLCEAVGKIEDPQVEAMAKSFGLSKSCPVPATKVCGSPDKKINISKFKNQLGLASGTTSIRIEVDHDVGKSCLEYSVSISKGKFKG